MMTRGQYAMRWSPAVDTWSEMEFDQCVTFCGSSIACHVMAQRIQDTRMYDIYLHVGVAAKSDGEVPSEEDRSFGSEQGYMSDSELSRLPTRQHSSLASRSTSPELSPNGSGGWILVSCCGWLPQDWVREGTLYKQERFLRMKVTEYVI
jgi:hypothetical protein